MKRYLPSLFTSGLLLAFSSLGPTSCTCTDMNTGVCPKSDGLRIEISSTGSVSSVMIDYTEIPLISIPGGFYLRELYPEGSGNLVANPGFNDVDSGITLHWTFVSGDGTVLYDDAQGHANPGSVRISIPGTSDQQSGYPRSDLIEAEPSVFYTFSAWGKSSNVNGTYAPGVHVVELDHDGLEIAGHTLRFYRDSDWYEEKISFYTGFTTSKLYVYADIYNSYGTFWMDDVRLESISSTAVPLGGAVQENSDCGFTQHVTHSNIAFQFDYVPHNRFIEVHGDIQDLTGEDRAIQVLYLLPVDASGWKWGDDIQSSREIEAYGTYTNMYKVGDTRTQNMYPFSSVSNGEHGLSLAVPLNEPRIYRIAYNMWRGYSIEFDFGLATGTDKIGHGNATFKFIIYKIDEPMWGFRAAAKKYFEIYPEFFVKRVENEGAIAKWDFAVSPVSDVNDFGVTFVDNYAHSGFARMTYARHGIDALVYSEPWGWWKDLGEGCTEPTYDEKLSIIQDDYLNGADNTTWKGMANDSYVAEVIMNCMPYNKSGSWIFDNDYLWGGGVNESLNYPTNPDPDLPSPNRFELTYLQFEHSNKSGIGCYDWEFGDNYFPRSSHNNWTLSSTEHRSGTYSASITVSGTPHSDSELHSMKYIPVSPSTPYSFSAWGKVNDVQGSSAPIVKMAEFDIDKTYLGYFENTHVSFGYGSTAWLKNSNAFATQSNTAYILPILHNGTTTGEFYVDDIELYKNNAGDNLIANHDFESVYNFNDYPCGGLRIDSVTTDFTWSLFENYRRSHWKYTDYPLVFSYDTKEPVLLGILSQYEFLENIRSKMLENDNIVAGNVFSASYSFYPHLFDVLGSELWDLAVDDWRICTYRTMSYQKPISNDLVWNRATEDISHFEVEVFMNYQMFYGMYPSFTWYNEDLDRYWGNSSIYERDRDLFVKYIPIIRALSGAGWEPIPYATCSNAEIKLERYGYADKELFFTLKTNSANIENGTLTVNLEGFGIDPINVTSITATEMHSGDSAEMSIAGRNASLNITVAPMRTLVYRLHIRLAGE